MFVQTWALGLSHVGTGDTGISKTCLCPRGSQGLLEFTCWIFLGPHNETTEFCLEVSIFCSSGKSKSFQKLDGKI